MFHIPIEERRGTGGFGADDSHKKLKTVMEKSGAKIEMSTGSKDQSLTFLITGKQESVLKARRDLLAQFQVRRLFTGLVFIDRETQSVQIKTLRIIINFFYLRRKLAPP